ncbi:MAG: septation protein A [Nitrosomonas sp.]|nr:MAG: septation protein A [Nitrosomonas sp.]
MKFLFDLFPVILFFVAFKAYNIFIATAVAIVAVIIQISWLWVRYRQVEKMMWLNLFIIIVLGGATLSFQDEIFIKWKPTVLYWLIATILLMSNHIFRKNLIQALLEKQMTVPEIIWNKLNLSWVGFFLLMGCINLIVAFNFTIDTWVTFKLFGATGLMLAFIVVQVLILGKYLKDDAQVLVINERDDFASKRTNKD